MKPQFRTFKDVQCDSMHESSPGFNLACTLEKEHKGLHWHERFGDTWE